MFVGISNTPRDYDWGSAVAIAELLGRQPSGKPEAELWLGAHPLAPSVILDPVLTGGHTTLDAFIAADPARALGANRRSDTLPFLLKVLAADQPLSIQAHPSTEQAAAGFARENAAGVPLDAPDRVYKDALAKPELTFALSDTFEALAGFRDVAETRLLVGELAAFATVGDPEDAALLARFAGRLEGEPEAALRDVLGFALGGTEDARAVTDAIVRAAVRAPETSGFRREYATLLELGERHPSDPGILVALLLNRVSLAQGTALYLPSGNVHAYLRGLAIEIMAASDNVLRGGLTSKHVDTAELQRVVLFEPVPAPLLMSEDGGPGVELFRPGVPDFLLARITVGEAGSGDGYQLAGPETATVVLPGPGIALALGGSATLTGRVSSATLPSGMAAFITPDEGELTVGGSATVFLATVNG